MIQPIFFPFTHLQATDIKVVSALFKSLLFFPASLPDEFEKSRAYTKNNGDKELLKPVYAESRYFESILNKVSEYRGWGEFNKENRGNLKAFLQEQPYLTDHASVVNIRAGIEKKTKDANDLSAKEIALFKNLMFLRLAKIHDMEQESLDEQFNAIKKNEQKLFAAMRGLDQEFDKKTVEEIGEYMTPQRVSAWVDFFNKKMPFDLFGSALLFVTTSSAVMDYLTSVAKNKIKILDIDKLKVHEKKCKNKNQWVDLFNKYIDNLVGSGQQSLDPPVERDDNCTLEVGIKLYLLQGDVISSFFQGVGQNIPVCLLSV